MRSGRILLWTLLGLGLATLWVAPGDAHGPANIDRAPAPDAAPAHRPWTGPADAATATAARASAARPADRTLHPIVPLRDTPPVQPEAVLKRILYAPANDDDPAYRAAIASLTGAVVDYYDAQLGTPTVWELAGYDCVYTWPNYSYFDAEAFGDVLADYVDAGGKVILGAFTSVNPPGIGGRIRTPGYSPVTGTGFHYSVSSYAGDGTSALHAGVLAYACEYRDILTLQGAGIADGHYADGEIALAYRPDGRVIFVNGGGGVDLAGTGDWAQIIANAVTGLPSAPSILYAPASSDEVLVRSAISALTGGPVNYFDATSGTPSPELLSTYDCVYTHEFFGYSDPLLFGDELADYVDAGGRVVLGFGCTYQVEMFGLRGRIMEPDYSPVRSSSPAAIHESDGSYAGDGTSALHVGVASYGSLAYDVLVGQGCGIVDGHYGDGEIATAYRPDGRVVYCNTLTLPGYGGGDWARLIANAATANLATGPRLLYAPSNDDDPMVREYLAAQLGGAVDYFDPRFDTPSPALLAGYDAVLTWANNPYADRVLFGDRLADYVDGGGKVILGAFCTYTLGNSLGGRIMQAGYSPVTSPGGDNHLSAAPYVGDGTTCFHHYVDGYSAYFRDYLVVQGEGLVDGHYDDGEIAIAYRPDRKVIYANGAEPMLAGGDWARLLANLVRCGIDNGSLYACTNEGLLFRLDPLSGLGSYIVGLPTAGDPGSTEIEYDAAGGVAWLQVRDGGYADQAFDIVTGAALGPLVDNGAAFNGLEFALGRLYGAAFEPGAGDYSLRDLDPVTGASTTIGPTGVTPVVGLAFDARKSALVGLTNGQGVGYSTLVRFDVTTGAATVIGPIGAWVGSAEFGPDGDLYVGGGSQDGGNLYRVNPTTGATALIGPTGFPNVSGITYAPGGVVAVGGKGGGALALAAPFPNPSLRGSVTLRFTLPAPGAARVELFDVAGRQVWQRQLSGLAAGPHSVVWDGRSSSGRQVGAGVYLAKLTTEAGSRAARLVRLD